jgi:hypothetical protein
MYNFRCDNEIKLSKTHTFIKNILGKCIKTILLLAIYAEHKFITRHSQS